VYLHILRLLSSLFGEKAELALVAGVGTLAVAVLLLLSGAWRKGVAEARRRGLPLAWVHAGNRRPGSEEATSLGEEQGRLTLERFPLV